MCFRPRFNWRVFLIFFVHLPWRRSRWLSIFISILQVALTRCVIKASPAIAAPRVRLVELLRDEPVAMMGGWWRTWTIWSFQSFFFFAVTAFSKLRATLTWRSMRHFSPGDVKQTFCCLGVLFKIQFSPLFFFFFLPHNMWWSDCVGWARTVARVRLCFWGRCRAEKSETWTLVIENESAEQLTFWQDAWGN